MKRVQISVDDDQYEVIARLADLRGWSMSYTVGDAIVDALPGWKREIRKLEPLRVRESELDRELARIHAKAAELAWN